MANQTDETKRKIEQLLLEARGLYECIRRAKVPASLGYALRDGREFDQLNNDDVEGICRVIAEMRKAAAPAPAAAVTAEPPPESPKNGSEKAPPLAPDAVAPPAKKKNAPSS